MASTLTRQRRARASQADADALLAGAPARDRILEAALQSVLEALDGERNARASLALGAAEQMAVVAVGGPSAAELEGSELALRSLEPSIRTALLEGRSVSFEPEDGQLPQLARRRGLLGRKNCSVAMMPIVMLGELKGMIVVETATTLSSALARRVETLGALIGPALEAVRLNADMHVHQSQERFRSIVQNSSDVVTLVDVDTTIRYQTPSVERVLGYDPAELVGMKLTELLHPEDVPRALAFFASAMCRPGVTAPVEWRVQHRDGSWLHLETIGNNMLHDPNVGQMVLNSRDISERKALEEQLSHQAFHDPLTDLANRALLKDRVERALARRKRSQEPFAVLFLDLDNFKNVNDSLGHVIGDDLLVAVAERLRECVRPSDTAARLGGDEFAIVLEDAIDSSTATVVAQRIIEALQAPITLDDKRVTVGTSVGIAMSDPNEGADELLRNADIAMYMAKSSGRGRFAVYEASMHAAALERLELESDLRRAIEREEFIVHYQPIVAMRTGRIVAIEALLRWQHPSRGLLPPSDFITIAEETGLILPIGKWVLQEACTKVEHWHTQDMDDPPLRVSVNISGRQLEHPEFVDEVESIIRETGIAPETLILEITESVMMEDTEAAVERLAELKKLGLKLSVDDFGTGYSSLRYLHVFPVDVLKIAKGFIDGLWGDEQKLAFVRTIVELCRTLGLETLAEGVESSEQAQELRKLGSELGQGDYLASPRPWKDTFALLAEGRELAEYAAEVQNTLERREAEWWKRALGGVPPVAAA
jgi:diguanylate cyclase (GGDEF)-like protein/PAS domain S-box-containing protein